MAEARGSHGDGEIDDSLYSRMRYMYGDTAMKKMAKSSVFISGLGGLGVESAKNIALAGVARLTLHDTCDATVMDQSAQFYVSDADIGRNRAEVSLKHVDALNPYCVTDVSTVDLASCDLQFLKDQSYTTVVMTDAHADTLLRVADFCHENGIHFIYGATRGVFAWLFVDFGERFEICDPTGENAATVMVADISRACPAEVTALLLEKKSHGLQNGDVVRVSGVNGLDELNGNVYRVKVKSADTISLWHMPREGDEDGAEWRPVDTSGASDAFVRGSGELHEERQGSTMSFLSLREALERPALVVPDTAKWTNPENTHAGMRALADFEREHGRLPEAWNWAEASEVVDRAKRYAGESDLDERLVRQLALCARGQLGPIAAFVGGVLAQEALKSVSGKFTPLSQWLYFDATELLPDGCDREGFDASAYKPTGSRYDAQIVCIGADTTRKLAEAKLFMIGSGAIGCEMLKNYAMLGVASSDRGRIIVTDDDLIEKSNLNRQFLFRPENIQQPKASAAAAAVRRMNPALHVNAHLDRVGTKTEGTYSDRFFTAMDVVVNALDNVEARRYVDGRCVANQKPLIESGTLGPKGHVETYVPFQTMSYASSRDPPEGDVPFCTLKTFPAKIDHCIQWACDLVFQGQFASKPLEYNRMLAQPDLLGRLEQKDAELARSYRAVARFARRRPASFADCIAYARQKFETYFVNMPQTLLHKFPLDHKNEDGSPFWANPKRPPRPLPFDPEDELHLSFVLNGALLWARVWGVDAGDVDPSEVGKIAANAPVKEFVLKDKKIETDEKAQKPSEQTASSDEIEEYRQVLVQYFKKHPKCQPVTAEEFEKDDDSNHHIDFISAAANMRARVYGLQEAGRLECKRIAGRIVPATATTTSAVSGLAALELIKVLTGAPFEAYKYWFMNLGLALFSVMEPNPVEKVKVTDKLEVTMWDRWEIKKGVSTLADLIRHFEEEKQLRVVGVCQKDGKMIYMAMLPMYKSKLEMKLRSLLGQKDDEKYRDLVITFTDLEGNAVKNAPVVRYFFRRSKKPAAKRS